MIIDTTYLFPLAGIGIDTDLLTAIDEGKLNINMGELGISMISLFEIQAKNAKLGIPPNITTAGILGINKVFRVQPFYNEEIIKISYTLKTMIKDYIDAIILATAIAMQEDLVTEDSVLVDMRDKIKAQYRINILRYSDLIG